MKPDVTPTDRRLVVPIKALMLTPVILSWVAQPTIDQPQVTPRRLALWAPFPATITAKITCTGVRRTHHLLIQELIALTRLVKVAFQAELLASNITTMDYIMTRECRSTGLTGMAAMVADNLSFVMYRPDEIPGLRILPSLLRRVALALLRISDPSAARTYYGIVLGFGKRR